MKEVIEVKETVADMIEEDVKKLENIMAQEGIAPMIPRRLIPEDEESLKEIVSRGMADAEEAAPSDPVHPIAELSTEIDIEGVGQVSVTVPCVGKVYTPPEIKKSSSKVFDSGLKVIKTHSEKIPVKVPIKISNVCNSLQRKVKNNEFSIVCKGSWIDGEFIITEDFKVPKQEVAGASVDYNLEHLEELKLAGYNTIIHSHPFKSSNFSHDDDTTINSHFECSILYSVGEFTTATIAISSMPGMKFILTGDPKLDGDDGLVSEAEVANIEEKYKVTAYGGYNDYYWYGGFDHNDNFRRDVGRNIGSDPGECEKEYDKYHNRNGRRGSDHKLYTETYEYDVFDDTIKYRNDGKPMNRSGRANARNISTSASQRIQPIKVHGGCGCGCSTIPQAKIFRTDDVHADQKPSIFRSDSPKNKNTISKNGKGKKNR
jgi:hypothetical protein